MAQQITDNYLLNAAKVLDDKNGILGSNGIWRAYDTVAEYLARFPNVNSRAATQTFWVKSTVNANQADLYAIGVNKVPYKVQADVDLSAYSTTAQMNTAISSAISPVQQGLDSTNVVLMEEIQERQDGDAANALAISNEVTRATNAEQVNANAIIQEKNDRIASLASKANSNDILNDVTVEFGDPNLVGNQYTNSTLSNMTVQFSWEDENGAHLPFITFNSSGVATLPITPTAGFKGSIRGMTGIDKSTDYVFSDYLFNGANQYLYSNDVIGFYIDVNSGGLISNTTSSVSEVREVSAGDILYVFNRTGNGGFRFLDSNNNPLKPLKVDNTPFATFSSVMNGLFKAPINSVAYQFTTQFTGTTNKVNIIVSYDSSGITLIKPELVPLIDQIPSMKFDISSNKDAIDVISSPIPTPIRVNKGENSLTPEAFPNKTEVSGRIGITVSADNVSPVSDIIKFKRTLSNTLTANLATCFEIWNVPIGVNRPPVISFAFWTKRTEFESIYNNGVFISYLALKAFTVNPSLVLNGTPQVSNGAAGTITAYTSAKMTMTKIYEEGDYIRLRITYSEILWKSDYLSTIIPFYYHFTGANSNGKSMSLIDFTVLFNEEPKSNTIYPDPDGSFGTNKLTLKDLSDEIQENKNEINSIKNRKSKVILRNNLNLYFSSPFDDSNNLVRRLDVFRTSAFSRNPDVNFISDYFADVVGDQTIVKTAIKVSSDDICPARIDGGYIAANHGWRYAKLLTKTPHGKTLADVGSVYVDSVGVEFVIMFFFDVNRLWIISKNQATDGYSFIFPSPIGDLTYVSNGVNTSTLTGFTIGSVSNMWPSTTPSDSRILLDGTDLITINGDYDCNFIDIVETYSVCDINSIIEKIITERPSGGYLVAPFFNQIGADILFTHYITYRLLSNNTTLVMTTFAVDKKLEHNFHGITQADALATGYIYVPKSLPIEGYDFRQIQDWNTGPPVAIHMTSDYWENPDSPPDRIINFNSNISFHVGYVTDRGVGLNRKDFVNDAIYLNITKKLYPMADSIAKVMNINEYYSGVAFRSYGNPSLNPAGRTSFTWFEFDGVVWLYLDYHGSLIDIITPYSEWIGKKIEVYEKNINVSVVGDVVTGQIKIVSTATSINYGYLVLRLI